MVSRVTGRVEALVAGYGLEPATAGPLLALLDLLEHDPSAPTAVRAAPAAVDVHVADSLSGLAVPALRSARALVDLGSGAGLPGLVLAAALPGARVALVESTARKCSFLTRAAATMGLSNVEVVHARAEAWSDGIGRADVVCARALAALPVLCEYAAPLLRMGGALVAWKGDVAPGEERAGRAAAAQLGLSSPDVVPVTPYPASERRRLFVLRKVAPTPVGYPRRPGMATKRSRSAPSAPLAMSPPRPAMSVSTVRDERRSRR